MSLFGKKTSSKSPTSKVISVRPNISGQGVKIIAENNLEFVAGRNVIVVDRGTKKTLGYGKVSKTDRSGTTLEIVPVSAELSLPTVRVVAAKPRILRPSTKVKIQPSSRKRIKKAPNIKNMIVQSIDY